MARPRIDMTGRKNEKLTVRHEIPNAKHKMRKLFCECECGGTRTVCVTNFWKTKSCLECIPTTANVKRAIDKSSIPETGTVTGNFARKKIVKVKEDPGLVEARIFSRSSSRGGWK